MREIWANELLPKALKSCPKSNKFPNLVTLVQNCERKLVRIGDVRVKAFRECHFIVMLQHPIRSSSQ